MPAGVSRMCDMMKQATCHGYNYVSRHDKMLFPRFGAGSAADPKGHMLPQREQWRIRPVSSTCRRFSARHCSVPTFLTSHSRGWSLCWTCRSSAV